MTNTGQHRKDSHYQKAKREGYRARSAFKLLEIQKRYNIFKRAFNILDIGSAPGSWLQVSKEIVEENLKKYKDGSNKRESYKIMGVDLKVISPIEKVHVVKMDFTESPFDSTLQLFFKEEKIDLILSDASINKTGNRYLDQSRQMNLCYKVLALLPLLKSKGNMILKAFQGVDYERLVQDMKPNFKNLRMLKPSASYKRSNEIYLIGLNKK
jgi:23S rRNA (uridine2552-2'-O)-methyltransferase